MYINKEQRWGVWQHTWDVGGMITYLGLAHILACSIQSWDGWGGVGGMITYLGLAHILACSIQHLYEYTDPRHCRRSKNFKYIEIFVQPILF